MKFAIGASVVALALVGAADAADLHVPAQYPTIQAAVNAAVPGDVVLVAPGTYTGTIHIQSKTISLVGLVDTAGNRPRLDGLGATRLIESIASDLVVDRFHFVAGNAAVLNPPDGGAILARSGGSLMVRRSHFEECVAAGSPSFQGGGGAIMTTDLTASSTAVEDCTFERNRAFRGSSLFGVRSVNRCRFEGGIGAGAIFSNNNLAVHTIRDSYLTHSVVYMVNTNLEMSGTWRCGDSPVVFEVAGSLADLGGNINVDECDCDANREADAEQLQVPTADLDGDGILDACQCIADVSGNGIVDGVDLAAVLGSWGSNGKGEFSTDTNGDGVVDGTDLATVLSGWGPCPS
jgi:hypothetical protein